MYIGKNSALCYVCITESRIQPLVCNCSINDKKLLQLRKELHLLGNTDFQHNKRGRSVPTPLSGQLFGQNEYIQNMKNTMRFNR